MQRSCLLLYWGVCYCVHVAINQQHSTTSAQCNNVLYSYLQAEPKPHLFPIMDESHPVGKLYQRIQKTMLKIHDSKGNIDELINIANEW